MALDQSALLELLEMLKAADAGEPDPAGSRADLPGLIEAGLTAVIGAYPHQRAEGGTGLRNGHRSQTVTTTAGDLELKIPRLRAGLFFPSLPGGALPSSPAT